MESSLNRMLVKRITHFPFCLGEMWPDLERGTTWAKEQWESLGHVQGRAGRSGRLACWAVCAPHAVLWAHHFPPATAAATSCAQARACSTLLTALPMSCSLPSFSVTASWEASRSPFHHESTNNVRRWGRWINTHPFCLQWSVSRFMLHESPQQNHVPWAQSLHGLRSSPERVKWPHATWPKESVCSKTN